MQFEKLETRQLLAAAPLFKVASLTSDTPDVPAVHNDPNIENAWGLSSGPGTEWWVANNGTGKATLYNGDGVPDSLVITIPPAIGNGTGLPTGQVFNGTTGFSNAQFIFSTEDGSISAWTGAGTAVIKVNNSASGAVYKGLAMGTFNGNNFLYATNFHTGRVEVYDSNFHLAHLNGSFRDAKIPAGYAPFGIQQISGHIFVTYALQDATKTGDVSGEGHGIIDVFNPDGSLLHRLVKGGSLNSPWGMARIPGGFLKFKHDVAVGNFGDGRIQVFDPDTGEARGFLRKSSNGHIIGIAGLWGLGFGNDGLAGSSHDLFFTAGPNDESAGLFGKLVISGSTAPQSTTGGGGGGGYVYPQSASVKVASAGSTSDHKNCDDSAVQEDVGNVV